MARSRPDERHAKKAKNETHESGLDVPSDSEESTTNSRIISPQPFFLSPARFKPHQSFPTSSTKKKKSSFLSGELATNPIGAFATNPPAELEASTAKKKAQPPSQGEEKASAVEPIAEEEGTPKLASLVERE